jgi:hypothetical protein
VAALIEQPQQQQQELQQQQQLQQLGLPGSANSSSSGSSGSSSGQPSEAAVVPGSVGRLPLLQQLLLDHMTPDWGVLAQLTALDKLEVRVRRGFEAEEGGGRRRGGGACGWVNQFSSPTVSL